jgi:glycosyltransferase involved in cell wall biosynthesis
MGHINRIESIYTMFDGFVLYSKNEGFGSSVIDAFLNKIPVLTSDVGGLHELVKNRGILITGNNTALLIDGFIQLLDNKNHQQIEDAYIFATETLSNQKIQQQYLQLFYSLTN